MTAPAKDFAVRLRRVKVKGGGDFTVLRSKEGVDGGLDWRGSLVANAKAMADCGDEQITAYFAVVLYGDGRYRCAYRYDRETCPIPLTVMPTYLAEAIRRDVIIEPDAARKFNEMFEWKDGA